jgi:hypothetical protein
MQTDRHICSLGGGEGRGGGTKREGGMSMFGGLYQSTYLNFIHVSSRIIFYLPFVDLLLEL